MGKFKWTRKSRNRARVSVESYIAIFDLSGQLTRQVFSRDIERCNHMATLSTVRLPNDFDRVASDFSQGVENVRNSHPRLACH